jgi:polysaccharide deacetylase family protein (PEP-CTERM system associated)
VSLSSSGEFHGERHINVTPHYFTVDVEEYFQVSAFEPFVSRAQWDSCESRVALCVDYLLEALDRHRAGATFFVLGWIAERHPDLVRRIAQAGHEVASHGWDHRRVTEQTPQQFRDSVRRSKVILEEASGSPVSGFRAPSYSIVRGREWALDILLEEGYRYDSSLFPVSRNGYGYKDGNRSPHWIERDGGTILEIPPATLRRWGLNIPAAGGAYFRLFPYALVRAAIAQAELNGTPATFYIHPWEIDPDQPRMHVPPITRLRHYSGIARMRGRLERLLREFRFTSIAEGGRVSSE